MPDARLVLYEQEAETFKIVAIGDDPLDPNRGNLIFKKIELELTGHVATLVVGQGNGMSVEVPKRLLVPDARGSNLYRLRSVNELGELPQEEWAALKDRIRRQLAEPIEIDMTSDTGFFGAKTVGDATLAASFQLSPKLVDGFGSIGNNEWVLRASGKADVNFSFNKIDMTGKALVSVVVKKSTLAELVEADFGFDLPQLPGFNLALPQIPLPELNFPASSASYSIALPNLPSSFFNLALPPVLGQLAFNWTTKPYLKVGLTSGKLTIATNQVGAGSFTFNGVVLADVTDVGLVFDSAPMFQATIAPTSYSRPLGDFRIKEGQIPFELRLSGNHLTVQISPFDVGSANNPNVSVKLESTNVFIIAKDDPTAFIALKIEVEFFGDGSKVKTRLTKLELTDPYPISLLLRGLEAAGGLIRLVGAIPLPAAPDVGLDQVLDRLLKMLVAAAKWLARQAGAAAELLAGLVEAVFNAILQLLSKLRKVGGTVVSHVAIEVRLDPKNYSMRQIVLMPAGEDSRLTGELDLSALGFDITLPCGLRPALMIDTGPQGWVGIVVQPGAGAKATLGTDLWLDKETGPQQSVGTTEKETGAAGQNPPRVIGLQVTPIGTDKTRDIVVAAIQRGRLKLFQSYESVSDRPDSIVIPTTQNVAVAVRDVGILTDGGIEYNGITYPQDKTPLLRLTFEASRLKDRLLSVLSKASPSGEGDTFFNKLKQKVEITSSETGFDGKKLFVKLGVTIHIDEDFAPETTLTISASRRDLSMTITGGDKIIIKGEEARTYHPLGFDLVVDRKDPKQTGEFNQFYLDFSHGNESFGLADEAKALMSYGKVSTSGKGLQFEVPTFRVGNAGFDLEARILPEPVKLGGVDVPFRFTSGQVAIKASRFGGGSLAGAGQLPQQLVGEANANIALQLSAGKDGQVIVESATARLDKTGDPIRCNSTRFELTITELGFDFVLDGSYHFYFLVTGSIVFKPGDNEYTSGLLKSFRNVEIKLDKAPLAADPRVLMGSSKISFQVKVDPPKKVNLFDIFSFDLRGFGFHPASPKFDGKPAMSISGQAKFTPSADKFSANIEFHAMWIGPPKPGSSKPRVRFDGLTVGLRTGPIDVEGTAIAVDESMPDLYDPNVLAKDVTAQGFLASGKLDIAGWASMSAAMGFLELRKKSRPPKHSFFLYGQLNKLAEPIDTPVGRIYLREFGFGFGYRYTLAGIAQAETAKSPQQLVKILDDVSKYQGSLERFQAWEPTYDKSGLTLALRGMFALSAASESSDYDEKAEKELANPLLFDIVAAFRTDFTFLINLRAWISVNYHDWVSTSANEPWKANPTMRGYLYFSVPRKEFLGRFIADGKGYVGQHPQLPKELVDALRNTQFSATLYVRPGLFHAELGWPYELGFTLGKPDESFYLKLRAGLVHRIEDASLLNGIAFKADGSVYLEGKVGNSNLGAAAVARANFSIEARVLSYISLKNFDESFYYGYVRIDVTVCVSVEIWLSFKIFGKRITLSAGFPLHLAVSVALEAVISPKGLGGRAHVSIGVRAFGRSLSISIGFSFNNSRLTMARAKVARFMELGLSAEIPDAAQDGQRIESNPKPEPPRSELSKIGDEALENDLGKEPLPEDLDEQDKVYQGRAIGPTDFWAMLFPTSAPIKDDENWYVMQLLPRDHTATGNSKGMPKMRDADSASFFASPEVWYMPTWRPDFIAAGHQLKIDIGLRKKANARLKRLFFRYGDGSGPSSHDIEIRNGDVEPFTMALGATVAVDKDTGQTLFLKELLSNLFLGPLGNASFTEPSVRQVNEGLVEVDADAKVSAGQLARSGRMRTNLTGKQRREAEIEEARSAVISAVTETASLLAKHGGVGGAWPERFAEIDARDFGLTFLINDSAIRLLFSGDALIAPPRAKFSIFKSDCRETEGLVHLFNHPDRMFRKAQPKFAPTHVIEQQGIKLNWDLEPDWGSSSGVYNDPEFHLKHYRVRRIIRNLPNDNEYRAEFQVKAAAPVAFNESDGSVSYMRPPFQFIDDLKKQDQPAGSAAEEIPVGIRNALLGFGTIDEWNEATGRNARDLERVDILYEIVPVDIAGTSDFGEVYVVGGFALEATRPISPREVTLQVEYAAMPTHVVPSSGTAIKEPPKLTFLIKSVLLKNADGTDWPQWPKTDDAYLLRIVQDRAMPSGGYGADALDEARRRPDQKTIDKFKGEGVIDFVLIVGTMDPKRVDMFAEIQLVNSDSPTVKTSRLGVFDKDLTEVGAENLATALGISNALPGGSKPAGTGYRMFLSALRSKEAWDDPKLRGEWRTLQTHLVIQKSPADKTDSPAISSLVEVLEQPVHLEFSALKRADMVRVESGRLVVLQPGIFAGLNALVQVGGGTSNANDDTLVSMRDGARRTATRLEWNARPFSLELTSGTKPIDLYRWIGGFDVYTVDPDILPGDDPKGEITSLAQPAGRVALLPPSMKGLDPPGFGDLSRIESAYPSETLRLRHLPSDSKGMRRASWFSSAETAAIFPEPSIRRSLMPDPDEGLISALFAGGAPEAIRISIPAWANDDPLKYWEIMERSQNSTGWGEFQERRRRIGTANKSVTFANAKQNDTDLPIFRVRDLRRLLQNLRLSPTENGPQEKELLKKRVATPGYLSTVTMRIEAIRYGLTDGKTDMAKEHVVSTQEHVFDLVPLLHPVLADALAFIQYAPQASSDELENADGAIFRRYAVAPDANPEVQAKRFEDYVDEVPAERDPYGWGALRTLGLASGLRLYDTETNEYVRLAGSNSLETLIRHAFERALSRYDNWLRDNGQPFLDILTQPWGNTKLFWFDGGYRNPKSDEAKRLFEDETLAVVQIALRPHPDRQKKRSEGSTGVPSVVRYYELRVDPSERPKPGDPVPVWTIGLTTHQTARFDVLGCAVGIDARKPVRLSKDEPTVTLYAPIAPAMKINARQVDKSVRIAVIRAVYGRGEDSPTQAGLSISPPRGEAVHHLSEIAQPAVLVALDDPGAKVDVDSVFGKFETLPAEDWADALFKPSIVDKPGVTPSTQLKPEDKEIELKEAEAYNRLAYYAGRRFAPLEVKVGSIVQSAQGTDLEETADALQSRTDLVDRIVRFWTRFVEHCAPAWEHPSVASTQSKEDIFFSLGTVADPGQWRRAPSSTGTVSVTIPDVERRGARRMLTVRPFGRYEAWSRAAPSKICSDGQEGLIFDHDIPVGLDGAFDALGDDDIGSTYFANTTLPRTEPLEKPVILSAVTHPAAAKAPGRLELVVAHGSDMVLAQANRRNAALLAPLDVSIGFWREFPHTAWLKVLEQRNGLKLEALAPFGAEKQRLGVRKLRLSREVAERRLVHLRQRVPDAWLGSTMITATHMPYFFRIHALVHAAAGVVVSEQVTTTFEEGSYVLTWPWDMEKGYEHRTKSATHRYSVTREGDRNNEEIVIKLDIAALRFIDCMIKVDASLWFGRDGEFWEPVKGAVHLPEPGVSYRISVETALAATQDEVLARIPEIEVLPNPPTGEAKDQLASAEKAQALYLLQQTGSRFRMRESSSTDGAPIFTTEPLPANPGEWRIPVHLTLAASTQHLLRVVPNELVASLQDALSKVPAPQPDMVPAIDGLHETMVAWTRDWGSSEWKKLCEDIVSALPHDSPEAISQLQAIAAIPPGAGGEIRFLLSRQAVASQAVKDALEAVANPGGKVDYGKLDRIILRRPPTDKELGVFKSFTELELWITELAQEQLFGAGRRLSVTAKKGAEIPITSVAVRQVED